MATKSRSVERQQSLEGIVTYCDDRLARVWIEAMKREKEISFAYRSRHFNLGDWLSMSLTTDEVHRITPLLQTRVLRIGVTQVRTEVIFRHDNEKIGHGIIIQSKHFDRVAVFTPFTGVIIDRIYRVYVERIPRDQRWNEQESGVYWFVPSNQIPELIPINKHPANDIQLMGPLIGIVVSKAIRFAFVWTPALGEGVCENHENLVIGGWIKFTADSHPENFVHININFCIIEWTTTDPILKCVPLFNNLMLISTIFISHWPMNNLTADWIGPVTDRDGILEKAVCTFGVGKTDGIVCFVDIQKSLALVYIQDINRGNGQMLSVDLRIFEAVPALGDWFSFKIHEKNQFWTVLNAMKSRKLCASHIFNGQLEVETEVVLTNKISAKGHQVMFSVVLGAVVDDANRLSNISLDAFQKYTVWCTTMQATIPNDPYWRITYSRTFPMKGALTSKPKLNSNTQILDDISYVGVVVGECRTGYFVWTPSLAEIIYHYNDGLRIGDWIRFRIRRKQRAHPGGKPFCINNWQKMDSLYPARKENNTAVVTVELMISEKHRSRQPPPLPFFGEVLDKKHCFGAHIDDIRGHIIEMDIKHVRTEKYVPSWDITFILVKGPVHRKESVHARAVEMNADPAEIDAIAIPSNASTNSASVQNAVTFLNGDLSLDVDKSVIDDEYRCCFEFERENENHSLTIYEGEKKEHGEDHRGRNDPQKEDIELDPAICSMKLLFMSKEVREAIKTNCMEEYTILRQYFDFVS
uniref:Bm10601 n=1 Tax=Loa loa TaxID=7209 RepID=A0A1I7VR90_LOALO